VSPSSESRPLIEPASRAELRAWLEVNHATSSGVRLAVGKRGTSVTALTYDDAVEEGLCFGWIDSTASRVDADRYAVLFTPRKRGSTWARSNKARVERLLASDLMRPAGLAAVESAKADGSWTALDHVDDLVMPGDLAAALAEDAEARQFWDALPPGHHKLALYWIGDAKRPETRARRIAQTVEASSKGCRVR